MAEPSYEPGAAVTAGKLTTVYVDATTDADDLLDYRPNGDVRYWHGEDITDWSDVEDDGSASEHDGNEVGASGGLVEKETGHAGTLVADPQVSGVITDLGADAESEVISSTTITSLESQPVDETPMAAEHKQSHEGVPTTTAVNAAGDGQSLASSTDEDELNVSFDEVDAVHPRLSMGANRRRSTRAAFVCDTCSRDTSGWQDCVDHAYRSGHGLAARCALCRLPAVRCRRKGRPGVWHRCVVTDTVRRLGESNVAALVAGSHLTSPRPWRLSCGECGTSFAAKTARLVRHVVERGHSVHRHCDKCLFPVFVFALNDERREMHVCVGNSAWLRAEEEALLTTTSDDAMCVTHTSEAIASEEGRHSWPHSGPATPAHHEHRHRLSHPVHSGLNGDRGHPNDGAAHSHENATSDRRLRSATRRTANGNTPDHSHHHANGGSDGGGASGGIASGSGGVGAGDAGSSAAGRMVLPLAPSGSERWPDERAPSCVAI